MTRPATPSATSPNPTVSAPPAQTFQRGIEGGCSEPMMNRHSLELQRAQDRILALECAIETYRIAKMQFEAGAPMPARHSEPWLRSCRKRSRARRACITQREIDVIQAAGSVVHDPEQRSTIWSSESALGRFRASNRTGVNCEDHFTGSTVPIWIPRSAVTQAHAAPDDHSDGVSCPSCGSERSEVCKTRATPQLGRIWRRRRCLGCGTRFSTEERVISGRGSDVTLGPPGT